MIPDEKLDRKDALLKKFIMYDDRHLHIIEFEKWAKTIDCKITIVDVINKKITKINY
jgi:hypothetical protein